MSWLTPQRQLRLLRLGARVPTVIWWPLGQLASAVLAGLRPRPLRQWERNASVVLGRNPSFAERWAAQWHWLRNTVGSLQLGNWSRARIDRAVVIDADEFAELQRLHAEQGLVLALPHMGSWDLAGAFASSNGLPVTSVAERLPAGQYEYFSGLREQLGMQIYPYAEPHLIAKLIADLRLGRTICLVADRDFGGKGLPVRWPTASGSRELTLPAGPVLIAQATGAALVGVGCTFARRRMHITLSKPITHAAGREGAEQMAQQLVEFFAAQIRRHPTDWHMMQRFFPGEVV